MNYRLELLRKHGLGLHEIQEVIATLKPLDGAIEFIEWLRERFQVVILSDTFYEFAAPFMKQLGYPMLLCHRLETDEKGTVMTIICAKQILNARRSLALKACITEPLPQETRTMIQQCLPEADAGILFHAPQNVIDEFPQFPAVQTFADLKREFLRASSRDLRL